MPGELPDLRKKKPRKPFAALAVVAGAVLLVCELSHFRAEGDERWFWVLVSVLRESSGFV